MTPRASKAAGFLGGETFCADSGSPGSALRPDRGTALQWLPSVDNAIRRQLQ